MIDNQLLHSNILYKYMMTHTNLTHDLACDILFILKLGVGIASLFILFKAFDLMYMHFNPQ